MKRVAYWLTGLVVGNALYGINVAADYVVRKTDRWMDYISDHTDHSAERFWPGL